MATAVLPNLNILLLVRTQCYRDWDIRQGLGNECWMPERGVEQHDYPISEDRFEMQSANFVASAEVEHSFFLSMSGFPSVTPQWPGLQSLSKVRAL